MLKDGGQTLRTTLLDLYNEIVKTDADTPYNWKQTQITVIHKSGDTSQPQNYRPIATIPLLYKLFSKMVYNRISL